LLTLSLRHRCRHNHARAADYRALDYERRVQGVWRCHLRNAVADSCQSCVCAASGDSQCALKTRGLWPRRH
jgi:hypothetical protein